MLVAYLTLDRVYSCPACGSAVIRTNVEDLDARGLRCPNRHCRQDIVLPRRGTPGQVESPIRSYPCRGWPQMNGRPPKRCNRLLFMSYTPAGRAWIRCPTCQNLQPVLLGDAPARMIVGQVGVVIGGVC